MNKIDKFRLKDSYVLLYCRGKKGVKKLVKICNQNKPDFWITNICSRQDNAKLNEVFEKLHERSDVMKSILKK